jgi:hypothetical protein
MNQDNCDDEEHTSSVDSPPVVNKTETPMSHGNSPQQSDCTDPPWYKSTNHWVVIFTAVLTVATILQWRTTISNHRTTERAWVTVKASQANPPIATGQIPEVAIELHNSGHSPALRSKVRQMVSIKDKLPDGPMPPIMATGNENYGVVGPDGSLFARFTPTNLTNDLIALLRSGKVYLFAYGTVKYFDIFDIEHETQYCFRLEDIAKIDLSPCGQWNTAN